MLQRCMDCFTPCDRFLGATFCEGCCKKRPQLIEQIKRRLRKEEWPAEWREALKTRPPKRYTQTKPNMTFIKSMVNFRRNNKMRVRELARLSKVAVGTIEKLESGNALPSEQILNALYTVFYYQMNLDFIEFCLMCGRLPEEAKQAAIDLLLNDIRLARKNDARESQNSLRIA